MVYVFILFSTVELLLKYGANPHKVDKQGFLSLHYAALNGHKLTIEMVRYYFFFRIKKK